MKLSVPIVLSSAFLAAGGGCTCQPDSEANTEQMPADTTPMARVTSPAEDSLARARATTEEVTNLVRRGINFDFDRSAIRTGSDTQVLQEKAAILQANPNLMLEIVGHCDERGTTSYNQALGMRRAESARAFLTGRGIAATRIRIRSMGETQPLDPAHNESAWARNRRNEFVIVSGGEPLRRP
jgi:peptidoglycan-associated lipoprotein